MARAEGFDTSARTGVEMKMEVEAGVEAGLEAGLEAGVRKGMDVSPNPLGRRIISGVAESVRASPPPFGLRYRSPPPQERTSIPQPKRGQAQAQGQQCSSAASAHRKGPSDPYLHSLLDRRKRSICLRPRTLLTDDRRLDQDHQLALRQRTSLLAKQST